MQLETGLLSKISDRQYRLLTIEGELFIDGYLAVTDGFHSNIDLSNVMVIKGTAGEFLSSGTFKSTNMRIESSDCPNDCVPADDCTTPNDCDCDCAEP